MDFTPQQQKAVEIHNRNLIVMAGAGSGKTRVLVARYLALLEAHPEWQLNELVAITFTEEAALEMRNRVRQALEEKLRDDPDRAVLWSQRLGQMDSARISTIHGLCASILRANAAEAGLDPGFAVLDAIEARLLLQDLVDDVLQRLSLSDPSAYLVLLQDHSPVSIREILTKMDLIARLDPAQSQSAEALLARWREAWPEFIRGIMVALRARPEFDELRQQIPYHNPPSAAFITKVWQPLEAVADAFFYSDDLEAWYAAAQEIIALKLLNVGKNEHLIYLKNLVMSCREQLKSAIEKIEPLNAVDERSAQDLARWYGLLHEVHQAYAEAKRAQHKLDFNDLESMTARLITEDPQVRARYRGAAFKHVLVDEFQDTNQAQWQIVRSLADLQTPGSLFVVGDIKQSIYGFRGADIAVFADVKDEIVGTGGEGLAMARSFRSHAGLVNIFNQLFSKLLVRDEHSMVARYQVTLDDEMEAHREDQPTPTPVELILLEKGDAKLKADQMREWEAHLIGQRIQEDVAAGRCAYGDVALLFQSLRNSQIYEDAFKKLGLPYVTLSGRGYFDRQEVWDLLNLLRALFNPADELALASALRSPIFGLSDDVLLALRRSQPGPDKLPLWQALMTDPQAFSLGDAQTAARLMWAANCLQRLHSMVGRMPIVELLHEILAQTAYQATLSGLPDGNRRRSNVEKLLTMAEGSGRSSVDDFLRYIQDLSTNEAREGEAVLDATQAVRLMSVHNSKGLEFPVVFMPDAAWQRGSAGGTPLLIYDDEQGLACQVMHEDELKKGFAYNQIISLANQREDAERLRLLYVAATRARDRLIISGQVSRVASGENKGVLNAVGWLGLLLRAFEVGDIAEDTYLDFAAAGDVRLHFPHYDADLIDAAGQASPEARAVQENVPVPLPLMAPLRINRADFLGHISVTQLSDIGPTPPEAYPAQTLLSAALADGPARVTKALRTLEPRVTQRLVGEIVHEALRYWRLPDESDRIDAVLAAYAWRFQLTHEDETREAIDRAKAMLRRFTQSETYRWIVEARRLKRPVYPELPFVYRSGERILHGVLDLLFQMPDQSWRIVDYKTGYVPGTELGLDDALAAHARRYYLQVGAYALAAEQELGLLPRVFIHYLRYHQSVEILPQQWQPEIAKLEAYIGEVIGSRDD